MTSLVKALARLAIIAGLALLAVFLLFSLSARPATAGSQFSGDVEGLEFCTQYLCGSAFFLGLFDGRVTEVPDTGGVWQLSVHHEEIPDPQQSAAINGGEWRLRVGWQNQFQGEVGGHGLLRLTRSLKQNTLALCPPSSPLPEFPASALVFLEYQDLFHSSSK